jgi:hypothetical protein
LALVLLALLGAMAAKSWLIEPPSLRSHNAAGEFDATRAKARLAFVLGDQRPHPADTPANDLVRGKIVTLLQSMGLKPIVRDQLACNELFKARGVACARVRNVIAVIGPPTGKALLLNAHYDSTPVGPGAGDDGIGVAALLEVASILKNEPLKRPLIFLFNEGEELGLVGARAFLADPLSRNVDSLVNLEARGVRGPANMFETSRPNAPAIALYRRTVAHPVANSLSTDVYRLLPNYTDVNTFEKRGWLTLNIAPIGNETRYHSPGDDVAALDPRTVQHMGDQTLALTRSLASGRAPTSGGETIFMDVAGRLLVALPLIVGVGLLVALLVGFAFLAWKRARILRGTAVALGTLVLSGALSWVALALIGAVRHGMFWRAYPVWTHLAVYASVMLAAVALIATLGGRLDRTQLRAGFWLVYLLLGAGIGILAPGGIIFFLFPPLVALLGMLLRRYWPAAETVGAWVAILILYLTWGAMLALLEELLNGGPMWLFAPLGALLILPVLIEARPLIAGAGPRRGAAVAGTLALLGWAAAAAAPAYSADRQQRFVIEHITDLTQGKAFWTVINDRAPLPAVPGEDWRYGKLEHSDRERWLGAAPVIPGLRPPTIEVLENRQTPAGRVIVLRLHPNGAQSVGVLGSKDADIRTAGTAGFIRPIDRSTESQKYYVVCHGRSCDGMILQLVTGVRQNMAFTLVGSRPGLPPSAAPLLAARPKYARPQYTPDQTVTISRVWL